MHAFLESELAHLSTAAGVTGLFSPAAGAWQLPGDASPGSWHGRKCLSGWSLHVLGSDWPGSHLCHSGRLGTPTGEWYPQQGSQGPSDRDPFPPDIDSYQSLSVISEVLSGLSACLCPWECPEGPWSKWDWDRKPEVHSWDFRHLPMIMPFPLNTDPITVRGGICVNPHMSPCR